MPAYRSPAEAEIRDVVVQRLRQIRPTARIMHEVNVSSFGNRVDVLAVDHAEIIAVEIKSAKDKLDRLPDQLAGMHRCAHHVVAALHEKFLVERTTNKWSAEYERDGVHYVRAVPDCVAGYSEAQSVWIMPDRAWRQPQQAVQRALPPFALDMLWRAELAEMCHRYGLQTGRAATMAHMTAALRWGLSGRDLTRGVCAALRQRVCIEGDAPIGSEVARGNIDQVQA